MKVLELFSGTSSIGKVALDLGWEVISVDIKEYKGFPKPTHKVDIMNFDYKQYKTFDIIWASPPCTYYSPLQKPWIGKMKKEGLYTKEQYYLDVIRANGWVNKAKEIIDYFKPSVWFIENPECGDLKKKAFMKGMPYYIVDYCCYSDWGFRKRTRIWTNLLNFSPLLCKGKGKCPNMIKTKHKKSLGSHTKEQPSVGCGSNRTLRFRIPPKLIKELLCQSLNMKGKPPIY